MQLRSIDPSECWVKHVVRGAEGESSAFQLGRVWFVRKDIVTGDDGLNGWHHAEPTLVLSDDGSFKLALANTAGEDGVLHRRRFAVITDEDYEPGEEWLEFWRDPNDLVFVGTPTDYEKTTSTVMLSGIDLNVVLAGSLCSDVDLWDAAAPADVLEHYSRMAVQAYGADLSTSQTGGVGAWSAGYKQALTDVWRAGWICEARLRWTSARPSAAGEGKVRLKAAGLTLLVDVFEGAVTVEGAPERSYTAKRQGLIVPGGVTLRIIARYDHIFCFVQGELVADFRRLVPGEGEEWPAFSEAEIAAYGGTVAIDGLFVETLADFAGRGESAVFERKLPGIPPATGLRAQFWNAAPQYAQNSTRDGRLARLWPLLGESEAASERIDPTVNFTAGAPPNIAGAYAARWSGAVYLDLAKADRNIKLTELTGNVRVYVGRTLRGEEYVSTWRAASSTPLTGASLRTWLGTEESGWYPIVIEQANETAVLKMKLEDREGVGAYKVIPQSQLSPLGVYSELLRLTSHRQIYGDVAQSFGYQWRTEYRSVESGEFPGQLAFRALIGRQTEIIIDDEAVGTEAHVTGSATDVIDGLVADAAGISDPSGAGQLSAQVIDHERATGHLALRQVYESLADITVEELLQTRIDSLLALRSSPNEQVGVRPRGQRDLVDTFPLTGTLARMDWQPGDGARLQLDSIDVKDESPRQFTQVSWPMRRDGIGVPTVSFRQRPRSVKAAVAKLKSTLYGKRRTYQGSVSTIPGSVGAGDGTGKPVVGASDPYSYVVLPTNMDRVVSATLVVMSLAGASWRVEMCGTDLGSDGAIPKVGRYDVTRALKRSPTGAHAYVRLIGGAEVDTYWICLEVDVIT